MNPLIQHAQSLAKIAHAGQVRKYTGEPYINHCKAVAQLVTDAMGEADPDPVVVAWLHDTVEDTAVTYADIRIQFGHDIAEHVSFLTDCDKSQGNRAARKAFDRGRLSQASSLVHSVKCADLIDNTSTIVKHDPKFAQVYLREKELLLPVLKSANIHLKEKAKRTLDNANAALAETKEGK